MSIFPDAWLVPGIVLALLQLLSYLLTKRLQNVKSDDGLQQEKNIHLQEISNKQIEETKELDLTEKNEKSKDTKNILQ